MTTTRKKWRLPICSRGQAGLLVVGFLAFFFLGVGGVNAALPVSPNTWQDINDNPGNYPNALALVMDEPLYNAIYNKYATTGTPKLDDSSNISDIGWITIDEAEAWGGTTISLGVLTGTIRGLDKFSNITTLSIVESPDLHWTLPEEWGTAFTALQHLGLRNSGLQGTIPESYKNLTAMTYFSLPDNQLEGPLPDDLFENMPNLEDVRLYNNKISGPIPSSLATRTQLKNAYLYDNYLSGPLSAEFGNLPQLVVFHIMNNQLSGPIPSNLANNDYTYFVIANNRFSGTLPAEFSDKTITSLNVALNPDLSTPSTKAPNWTNYTNYTTKQAPEYDLNRTSTGGKYAEITPQDGDFMSLNQDLNGDGHADFNLTYSHNQYPNHNIDVNGDGKADLNIILPASIGRGGSPVVYNQAKAITTTSDGFLGWVRPDVDYVAGKMKADFEVSPEYPYYIIAKTDGALTGGTGTPPLILELNKQVGDTILNIDTNNDGIPDENIDINGDNIPDYNVKETPPTPPTNVPTSSGGGGGSSLKADSCPAGDLSPSYYDGTCGTTADLAPLVAAKVNVLRPLIRLIYITATEKEKTLVHDIITSCSQTNKKEVIKLACQELVANWDF